MCECLCSSFFIILFFIHVVQMLQYEHLINWSVDDNINWRMYFTDMPMSLNFDAGQECAGKVTLRHIYEIARIKGVDPCFENIPMERICQSIIGAAHSCGIDVVRDLDAEEYGAFLEERRKIVEQQETELQEAKAAKLLRVAV